MSKVVGVKECAEALAVKKGITKTQAEKEIKDVVNLIADMCVENEGVSFKGLFSLKKVLRKGREGAVNGKAYKTEDKYVLKATVYKDLDEAMNTK